MRTQAERTPVQVIDLTPEREPLYFVCLEDWEGSEMPGAGDWKARWYEWAKPRGLRVKLARDARGEIGGMIQYLPIEHAPVVGRDLDYILCTWVHGHPLGRGDARGRGLGSALLAAAEADSRARGKKGIAAWGLALPVWMRASWYRKHGFVKADRVGMAALVELRRIDTRDRATFEEWGQSDALWIDGKAVRTGPPPSERKLSRLIGKRAGRL